MNCIYCKEGKTKVTETVSSRSNVMRKRKCVNCGQSFFTEESTSIRNTALRAKFWNIRRGVEGVDNV